MRTSLRSNPPSRRSARSRPSTFVCESSRDTATSVMAPARTGDRDGFFGLPSDSESGCLSRKRGASREPALSGRTRRSSDARAAGFRSSERIRAIVETSSVAARAAAACARCTQFGRGAWDAASRRYTYGGELPCDAPKSITLASGCFMLCRTEHSEKGERVRRTILPVLRRLRPVVAREELRCNRRTAAGSHHALWRPYGASGPTQSRSLSCDPVCGSSTDTAGGSSDRSCR